MNVSFHSSIASSFKVKVILPSVCPLAIVTVPVAADVISFGYALLEASIVAVPEPLMVQVMVASPTSDACFVEPSWVSVNGMVIEPSDSSTDIVELVNCITGGESESLRVIV